MGSDVAANFKSELKKTLGFSLRVTVEMNHEDHKHGDIGQQGAAAGNNTGSIMWLLAQMIRVPLTAFVSTIEIFISSMRGIQSTTNQVIEVTVGETIQRPDYNLSRTTPAADSFETRKNRTSMIGAELKDQQSQKEQSEMEDRDIDLRGDDLKLLEYDIWFTKSDLEAFLDGDKEVVAYTTTLGDYKGVRITKFLRELKRYAEDGEPLKRPRKWLDNQYPPEEFRVDENGTQDDNGRFYNGLPQDDVDEYVKVDVRLIGRRPKDEKDESDRLKDINKTLRGTLNVHHV